MNIVFKDIRIVSPTQNIDKQANLWIKDGAIHKITSDEINDIGAEYIDASKFIAMPGLFDMHVHLREPGFEYKEDINSGCRSAANGGFTGVCCMPNTYPAIDDASVVELIKNKAKGNLVDVEIAAAITKDRKGEQLSPMLELHDCGVRIFTDDGDCVSNSEMMRRAFYYAASKDLLISQHAEDATLTEDFSANEGYISEKLGLKGYPTVAEEIIISRDIMLSEFTGQTRYHVSHISSKGSKRMIKSAKERGLRITCEVTPHHFLLADEELVSYSPNLKMNPPLRTKNDIEAMIEGLSDGTIDCIASDHAPHALHEKEVEFEHAPHGIIGLETSLSLVYTYLVDRGLITLKQLIEKMSVNPRRILGIDDVKIEENSMANITIFAPNEEWIVNKNLFMSKARNTPFDSWKLKGKPKFTLNNNKLHKCVL